MIELIDITTKDSGAILLMQKQNGKVVGVWHIHLK